MKTNKTPATGQGLPGVCPVFVRPCRNRAFAACVPLLQQSNANLNDVAEGGAGICRRKDESPVSTLRTDATEKEGEDRRWQEEPEAGPRGEEGSAEEPGRILCGESKHCWL